MTNADILKNAEAVFSIPSSKETKIRQSISPSDTCKRFLLAAKESAKSLDISFSTEVEELRAVKSILITAFQATGSKELRTIRTTVSEAGKTLNSIIKAIKWKNMKKHRHRITDKGLKNSISYFFQKIDESLEFLNDEFAKSQKTFYSNLSASRSNTPLPLHLEASKLWVHVKADVLIYSKQAPLKKHKRVEEGCYLMSANLVAVNTDRYKGTAKQTEHLNRQVISKLGATLYNDPVPRISQNVRFFLVLDFGCNITNCHFVDTLQTSLPEITVEAGTDIAIATRKLAEATIQKNIERQRSLRLTFERDNETLVRALTLAEREEENLREEFEEASLEYRSHLAYPDDPYEGKGLPYTDRHKLDSYIIKWMLRQLEGETDMDTRLIIRKDFFKIKMQANIQAEHIAEIRKELSAATERVKYLTQLKANTLEMFAASNGIVSPKIERLFMTTH